MTVPSWGCSCTFGVSCMGAYMEAGVVVFFWCLSLQLCVSGRYVVGRLACA